MTKPGKVIEDEQYKLKKAILSALEAFTEATGVTVQSMSWEVMTTLDANGNTTAARYRIYSMDLATGASQ